LVGIVYSDDDTLTDTNGFKVWYEHLSEALQRMGRPAHMSEKNMCAYLEEAGFTEIVHTNAKHPLSAWPKDRTLKQIGHMNTVAGVTGYHAYGQFSIRW
jgi:hypothetical protein